jgi:hypothetical protein
VLEWLFDYHAWCAAYHAYPVLCCLIHVTDDTQVHVVETGEASEDEILRLREDLRRLWAVHEPQGLLPESDAGA